MHRYIPISDVEYRCNSLNKEYDTVMENRYIYTPSKKSSYSKKKEFLEFCDNVKTLNNLNSSKLKNSLLETVKDILENGTKSQVNETVSIIKNNYIPKMNFSNNSSICFIKSIKESLCDEDIKSINEEISKYNECDRVISNDIKLSRRFNFNRYINENADKDPKELIYSLCEMIDTYNIPIKAKYNVALENIQYSLYKSGLDKKCDVVKNVTDYFLLREEVIPDTDYKNMTVIVNNNQFTDPEQLSRLKMVKEIDRQKYLDKIKAVRDKKVENAKTGKLLDKLMTVNNEEQADDYIKSVYNALIQDSTLPEGDKVILKNSINMLPLISPVDKAFIEYNTNKLDGNLLSTRDLIETASFLNSILKDSEDKFGDYYNPSNILESFVNINCSNIHDYVEDFKIDQDKSPKRFIKLLSNLNPNDNETAKAIVEELSSIFDIVKYTYTYSPDMCPEAIYTSISDMIYKFISNDIDPIVCSDLIKELDKEKKIISTRNDSVDDSNVKDKIMEYDKVLSECIDKLSTYISSYMIPQNESFSVDEDDMSFEEYASLIETLVNGFEDVSKLNKEELLSSISDNIRLFTTDKDNLRNLSNIIMVSKTIDKQEYGNLLKTAASESNDYNERSNIKEELSFIESFNIETDVISESLIMIEAINILNKYFVEDAILEAVPNKGKPKVKKSINFNDLKIAFKAFQTKVKKLSAKEQAFWRNVDMYGNNIIKSMQRSLTSDRREAIIKGSIIPSMSKCIKTILTIAGTTAVGAFMGMPYLGIITAIGIFASSKYLNNREKQLIYDEIDTELKVVDKELEMAQNDGDMKKYRFLLQYQKKLTREKARIKYGSTLKGMAIPNMPTPPQRS